MSYMTPYYFTGSAGMTMSIWLRSNDFQPKVGLALSGSTSLLAEGMNNAWQYDSAYSCAAIDYALLSDDFYMIEATSVDSGAIGDFKLYISQGATASLNTDQSNGINRLTYCSSSDRIFSTGWHRNIPSSLVVIDPQLYITTSTFIYSNSAVFDCVYNSVDNNIWVWYSGSTGQYLDVYNNNGSTLLFTHTASVDFKTASLGFYPPRMSYNPDNNQILFVPSIDSFATPVVLDYYIFDCNTNNMVHSESMVFATGYGINCTYANSTKKYYIVSDTFSDFILKVDPISYTSSVSLMNSASLMISYIKELDVLVGGSYSVFVFTGTAVYNPNTETVVTNLPGIYDAESNCIYDSCRDCIVIPDDSTGNSAFNFGGLDYIFSGSYNPSNFVSFNNVFYIEYCNSTSTVWASNHSNGNVIAIVSSTPTGSLLQPDFPVGCNFDINLLSNNYGIVGYYDGLINNTSGAPSVKPDWDGTFKYTFYPSVITDRTWGGSIFNTVRITGNSIEKLYIQYFCINNQNQWKIVIGLCFSQLVWSGVKIGGDSPVGIYTNDGTSIESSPTTLTISQISGSPTPNVNYYCGA